PRVRGYATHEKEARMTLTEFQEELCTTSRWDFSDLKALFVNCTLKPSPELSHTEGLMRISTAIMERNGVTVDFVRAVDHDLAPGVWPDMREHGATSDGPGHHARRGRPPRASSALAVALEAIRVRRAPAERG